MAPWRRWWQSRGGRDDGPLAAADTPGTRCRAHDRSVVRTTPSRLFDPFAANCRRCVDGGDDLLPCVDIQDSRERAAAGASRTGNTSWRGLAPTPFYLAGRDEFDDPWAWAWAWRSQFRGGRCVEALDGHLHCVSARLAPTWALAAAAACSRAITWWILSEAAIYRWDCRPRARDVGAIGAARRRLALWAFCL